MSLILLAILIVGFFLRSYKPLELFMYGHDQDLAGWIIKDILVNGHLRLIGQETSSQGIFIGPIYYYLQIPFYILTNMDPKGALLLSLFLGLATIFSFYYVFKQIFNKNIGLVSSLIYSLSTVIVFTDREVAPTMPVMLWSVWFFYSLFQLLKGNQKSYILIGLLLGLVWHLNLGMAVLFPLVILAQILSKTKVNLKNIFIGGILFTILMSPFIAFEIRHDYQQIKSIRDSITTNKGYVPGTGKGLDKLDRVRQLIQKNASSIYWGSDADIPSNATMFAMTATFILLVYRRKIPFKISLIALFWMLFYILFFTLNAINVSEYYLNGMNVIWIMILAVLISEMIKSKTFWYFGYLLLIIFIIINIQRFFSREVNKSGYIERRSIVKFIKEDAIKHDYPCVSVSYITSVGNDLGYRYFFWLEDMRVEQSKSGAPVYSIVYPLSKVSGVDKTFGVLGLVLPDYSRYNQSEVDFSCSGGNSNLTDPLFGYTE